MLFSYSFIRDFFNPKILFFSYFFQLLFIKGSKSVITMNFLYYMFLRCSILKTWKYVSILQNLYRINRRFKDFLLWLGKYINNIVILFNQYWKIIDSFLIYQPCVAICTRSIMLSQIFFHYLLEKNFYHLLITIN